MRIPDLPDDYWDRHFSRDQLDVVCRFQREHWDWLIELRLAGWVETGGLFHRFCCAIMDIEIIWWSIWTNPGEVFPALFHQIDRHLFFHQQLSGRG